MKNSETIDICWQRTTMLTITPINPNVPSKDDPKFFETLTPTSGGLTSWTNAELSPYMEYKITLTKDSSNITGFELVIRGELMPGTHYAHQILREQPREQPS